MLLKVLRNAIQLPLRRTGNLRWALFIAVCGSPLCTVAAIARERGGTGMSAAAQASRNYLGGTWRPVGGVPRDGRALVEPGLLGLADSSIIVYDYGDRALKKFSWDGHLLWKTSGPSETRFGVGVSSLAIDGKGQAWLSEASIGRVTVIGADGGVERVVLNLRGIHRILPLSTGEFLATFPDSPLPRLYGADGTLQHVVALPPPLQAVSPIVGESWLAATRHDTVVLAYLWSDRFAVMGRGGPARVYRGVETREFPQTVHLTRPGPGGALDAWVVDSTATPAALSLSVFQDSIFILFGGSRGARSEPRIVDVYALKRGRYIGSLTLPEGTHQMAMNGPVAALLAPMSHPAIHVWRWSPAVR